MNSSTFDQILRQVVIVPLLAVLLGAGALYYQIRHSQATVANIELSDERIAQTLLIERMIVDEETGLRGYQTTGDPVFLEPYRTAERQLPIEFDKRLAMTTNPERHKAFLELEQAHETWKDGFADPLIDSIQAGGNTNNVELNLQGKRMMDDIRQRMMVLSSKTEERRAEYIQAWRTQVRRMGIALICTALLIGLVIGLYTRRLLQDVSRAFRESNYALRIRAEQAFRSEQKLRTTLRSIGDGVITCDPQGRIQTMNEVASDLTGWAETEARNLPLDQVFQIVDEHTLEPRENPVEKIKRVNTTVAPSNHTILKRRDGSDLFISENGAPIRDKQAGIVGVVLVFRDVTMARKSQQALLANEKLAVAGRLAATIAHEIHNPLDSISNLLFLMDGKSTPEESEHFLQLAKQETQRVTQISRAMLSLYRESKAPVAIDLKEMLCSILLLMERRFESLGVQVHHELPDGLIIQGFPAELRQVFTNLLTNAAEAAGDDHQVNVRATHRAEYVDREGIHFDQGVQVAIEDHGSGIPEEVRTKLFQPFFTTKGERGTGLGLWVSRGIIVKQGGAIDLESSTRPEDHGTTVNVFLAAHPVIHPAGD